MKAEDQILFERFINHELVGKELLSFKQKLKDDIAFNEDFELYKSMNQFVGTKEKYDAPLKSLQSVQSEYRQSLDKKKSNFLKPTLIILALASLAGLLFFYSQKTTETKKMTYADLYVEPTWPTTRSSDANEISQILAAYLNNDNIEASKQKLRDIDTHESNYWLAEIYAKEGIPDSVFKYIPKTYIKEKSERINFIVIMALFKQGDLSRTQSAIQRLPEDTDEFYKKIYAKIN